MPNRHPKDPTPDLFAAVAGKAPRPRQPKAAPQAVVDATGSSQPRRYLLPKDLAGALTSLDDREIDALFFAVTDEAKRRGRLLLRTNTTSATQLVEADRKSEGKPQKPKRAKPAPSRSGRAAAGDGAPSLTVGKANAVRAAFMAGVKPSTIARQFGISQAAVRQALAAETPGRRS